MSSTPTPVSGVRHSQVSYEHVGKMLLIFLSYYLAARLSLRVALIHDQVTPIWPPTGIALVGMLLFGRRIWPAVTLAAFLVNAPIGPTPLTAAGVAVGNTLAPLLGAYLLEKVGFRRELDRLHDVLAIVFLGALLSMGLSATGGALTLVLSGAILPRSFLTTWSVWWTGDAMGVLIVAPLLLMAGTAGPRVEKSWRRRAEATFLFVGLPLVTYALVQSGLRIQYLVFPLLGWAAWEFGQRGAGTAALLTTGTTVWAAVHRVGPFAHGTLLSHMVTLQVFNATVAITCFVLAAVRAERLRHLKERDRAEAELARQALHDRLTGLPNMTLFMDRLGQALARSERRPGSVAVMFLDLDRFKLINDSLGHATGNLVLQRIADRLQAILRSGDSASRFGGDEFVVLCEVKDDRDAMVVAQRLVRAVAEPIPLTSGAVVVTTSAGVALSKTSADPPEQLVRDADTALYRAKEHGRARCELFDGLMRARTLKRLEVEGELRRAIEHGELRIHYQPVVRIGDGRIAAWEALVRWEHPKRGLLEAPEFVPVAEEIGLIIPLGDWVLKEVCRQWARWRSVDPERPLVTMAVNLSTRQLADPRFEDGVRQALADAGMKPTNLSLEITESVFMEAAPSTLESLRALRELGVHLAIDDFGTGYSSLSYLKRIKADTLKIDRTFVSGLGQDPEDSAIVTAILSLAHALGLNVVAEGVETAEQLAHLNRLGCEMAQGFYFADPQPAEALAGQIGGLALVSSAPS